MPCKRALIFYDFVSIFFQKKKWLIRNLVLEMILLVHVWIPEWPFRIWRPMSLWGERAAFSDEFIVERIMFAKSYKIGILSKRQRHKTIPQPPPALV